jgi:hypothetical protein
MAGKAGGAGTAAGGVTIAVELLPDDDGPAGGGDAGLSGGGPRAAIGVAACPCGGGPRPAVCVAACPCGGGPRLAIGVVCSCDGGPRLAIGVACSCGGPKPDCAADIPALGGGVSPPELLAAVVCGADVAGHSLAAIVSAPRSMGGRFIGSITGLPVCAYVNPAMLTIVALEGTSLPYFWQVHFVSMGNTFCGPAHQILASGFETEELRQPTVPLVTLPLF